MLIRRRQRLLRWISPGHSSWGGCAKFTVTLEAFKEGDRMLSEGTENDIKFPWDSKTVTSDLHLLF